jgi:Zn-dependent protease
MGQWWVHSAWYDGGPVLLGSWIIWVLGAITLHELAHGWAALWEGDTTPRDLGHMSANPVVHMGTFSLVLFAMVGIAFGAMPVRPERFRHGHVGEAIVAAAGPAMNLLLAFVTLTAAGVIDGMLQGAKPEPMVANILLFLTIGGWLNLVLAALNLLPITPLDGSRILAAFVPGARRLFSSPNAPIIGMGVLLAIFMSGIASVGLNALTMLAAHWRGLIAGLIG